MSFIRRATYLLFIALTGGLWAITAQADPISVQARVENTTVYVGQPFVLQLDVNGSDTVNPPTALDLPGFTAAYRGGQQRNSTSIQIVNGRTTKDIKRGYVFQYTLTAHKEGTFTIPSIAVNVDGKSYNSNPIPISVQKPMQSDDAALELTVSNERCYVGEPILLTLRWYIKNQVRNFAFTVPVLQAPRFSVEPLEDNRSSQKKYYRVSVNGEEGIAEEGQGRLKNTSCTTLTLQYALIPKAAGVCDFPAATVAYESFAGYQRSSSRGSLFDDFFGSDPFGRRGVYKPAVAPSSPLQIEVLPLPTEGQPQNFSGLVGNYRIETTAAPTNVNVGDPITLTIRISGPAYLQHVDLPALENQADLAKNFKIPKERADAKVEDGTKVFTQTLRASNDAVTEIPPIALSFFDSKTGRYRTALSKAIPLTVHETTLVTAEDMEGRDVSPTHTKLTAHREGIAHNYEDPGVLTNQEYGLHTWLHSPLWMAVLCLPSFTYLLLAGSLVLRRRGLQNPKQRRARKACATFVHTVKSLPTQTEGGAAVYDPLLEALRIYLGDRLQLTAGALTFADVAPPLQKRKVSPSLLNSLETLFSQCEAWRYTGGQGSATDSKAIVENAITLVQQLDKELGK